MIENLIPAGILGVGSSLPAHTITNFDLEKTVETSDEWIVRRTGISARKVLDKDEPSYKLGVDASLKAIKDAGISAEDIDLIIVSTNSPDYLVPSTACLIQKEIGAVNAAAFDFNAACAGFAYGITVAQQYIATGFYKHVLLVGCEGLSKVTDWEDRKTCILFADGAGAAIMGPVEKGYGVVGSVLGADGTLSDYATLPCNFIAPEDIEKREHENKRVLWLNGTGIMKFGIKAIVNSTKQLLEKTGLTLDDIKYIVPHQANIRIMDDAAKGLGISKDKMFANIAQNGNCSSATIPVALDEMNKQGLLSKGDNIVMVGFGGGVAWGAALVKWSK